MKPLSDSVVARLQADMRAPDFSGTRYNIVRYLARGGMGSVWLAEDTVLNRHVALKVLDLVAPADDFAARLLQEACILAGLEHPGIVPIHDAGTLADGRAFYCMKYVEGQTLAQHIVGKTLPDRLRLLDRIAETMDFAHARGCIHRDLKPENIMIGAFGEVLVMDWGLAKVRSTSLEPAAMELAGDTAGPEKSRPSRACVPGQPSARGSVVGTPGYMSPEQACGNAEVDYRTDIFSLGAILQFLLAGGATDSTHQNQPADTVAVPPPLAAICAKAMASDPNARYQSAREMTTDTAHYLNGEPVSAYPESLLERAARLFTRYRVAVILVAAYLFMRILFVLFARR